jgi:hypothetical protein
VTCWDDVAWDAVEAATDNSVLAGFWVGKLPEVTYNVALLAVLNTLFAALVMQRPMADAMRIVDAMRIAVTLTVGGFYPAVILLGLSYSVAAGRKGYSIPRWLLKGFWNYVP